MTLPYGAETGTNNDRPCCSCFSFCYLCMLADFIMNFQFEEVIDCCKDEFVNTQTCFKTEDEAFLGWYFIFEPVITLLAWIPLVGFLLNNVLFYAALIFALLVGTTMACLLIGMSWVYFKPVYGIILLAVSLVGVYFIAFYVYDY